MIENVYALIAYLKSNKWWNDVVMWILCIFISFIFSLFNIQEDFVGDREFFIILKSEKLLSCECTFYTTVL